VPRRTSPQVAKPRRKAGTGIDFSSTLATLTISEELKKGVNPFGDSLRIL
jgi:hypothetical protein